MLLKVVQSSRCMARISGKTTHRRCSLGQSNRRLLKCARLSSSYVAFLCQPARAASNDGRSYLFAGTASCSRLHLLIHRRSTPPRCHISVCSSIAFTLRLRVADLRHLSSYLICVVAPHFVPSCIISRKTRVTSRPYSPPLSVLSFPTFALPANLLIFFCISCAPPKGVS